MVAKEAVPRESYPVAGPTRALPATPLAQVGVFC